MRIHRLSLRKKLALSALIAAAFAMPHEALAVTYYWDRNGATAGFGTAGGTWAAPTTGSATQGWSTSAAGTLVPGDVTTMDADLLNFGTGSLGLANGTITVSGTVDAGSMTFDDTNGNNIRFDGGTIGMAAATTISVNGGNDVVWFNTTVLTGAANTNLTKNGIGILRISANNSAIVGGNLNINNGIVRLTQTSGGTGNIPNALGGADGWTVQLGNTSGAAAATLQLGNSATLPNAIVVRAGSTGVKTIGNSGNINPVFSGVITANDNLTVSNTGTATLTVNNVNNVVANTKIITFSNTNTGTLSNAAIWSGMGGVTYTGNNTGNTTASNQSTYAGTTTLGTQISTGSVVPTVSSMGLPNAPTSGPFGTGTLSIGATRTRASNGGPITIHNPISFDGNPTFTTTLGEQNYTFTGDAALGATRTLTTDVGSNDPTKYVEFSGNISGGGFGVTKEGTGNLLLSGANTYTGDTTVNAGTLNLTGSLTDSNVAVTGTGALSQNAAGLIAGTATLTHSSSGISTLAGSNTFNGATSITGGTLNLSGAGAINSSSGITVNGAGAKLLQTSSTAVTPVVTLTQGTLTGNGTINTVDVGAGTGGVITNNDGVAGAALTIGALTFNGAATINTFANSTAASIVTTSLSTNAAGIVTINPTNTVWSNGTTYNLISYGGGSIGGAGFGQFALGTLSPVLSGRQMSTFGDTGSMITVAISGDNPKWTGLDNGNWQLGTTGANENWQLVTALTPTTFLAADDVLFDDSAAGTTTVDINLADVAPTFTTFNNTAKNYSLTGAFGIAAGNLTKTGTGNLTIGTVNTYTGPTNINAGVIIMTGAGTLGTGSALTLGGGALDLGTTSQTVGAVSVTAPAASGDTISNGTLTGTSYAVSNTTGNVIVSAVLAGAGTFSKSGAGTTTLTGANTYSGTTTISEGILSVNSSAALGDESATNTLIFDGGTLQAAGGSIASPSTRTVSMTGAGTIDTNGNAVSIAGSITGLGGLTKSGLGTLSLTANNNFAGGITINANSGTLQATKNADPTAFNALGSGAISIDTGSTLLIEIAKLTNVTDTIANTFTGTGNLTLNFAAGATNRTTTMPNVTGFNGTIRLSNAGATGDKWTASGVGTVPGSLVIDSGSTIFVSSATPISFTGGVTLNGAGSTENRGAIRLTGATTKFGGNINLASSSTVSMENLAAEFTANFSSNAVGAHTLTLGAPTGSVGGILSGIISDGTGTIAVTQAAATGVYVLSGLNTYTGATTVNAGTLSIASDDNLGTAPGAATPAHLSLNGGTLRTTAAMTLNANRGIDVGASNGTINVSNGDLTSGQLTYNGIVAGAGALTKLGIGTLILGGNNTNSGFILGNATANQSSTGTATANSGGYVLVGHNNALGTGIVDSRGAQLHASTTGIVIGNNFVVGPTGGGLRFGGVNDFEISGNIAINTTARGVGNYSANTTITLSGTIDLSGSTQAAGTGAMNFEAGNAANFGAKFIVTGPILGSPTVGGITTANTFDGSEVTLTNAGSTFDSLALNEGIMHVAQFGNKADAAGFLGTTDVITFGTGGATLRHTGAVETSDKDFLLNAAGAINSSGSGVTLSGVISGVGALTKTGASDLTLTGTNTYGGTTTVSAGKLVINGDNSGAAGIVSVASTATLGGDGIVGGATTVDAGAIVSPGNSIGSLTFNGNLTIDGTYLVETATFQQADLLDVDGILSLGAASVLDLDIGSSLVSSETYVIADYTGGSLSGTFFTVDPSITTTHDVVYGFNGTQIALVPIPEPSTLVLGGLALLGFAGVGLRRRRIRVK